MLLRLLALAAAVPAAPPPPPSGPDIVVEAQQQRRALNEFVRTLTQPGLTGQLARWTGICPVVLGVEPNQAQFMAARIREAAKPLHLDRMRANCQPTTVVVVTPDASGLATEFAKAYPVKLKADGRWKLRQFAASALPVRWLGITDPCGIVGCSTPNSRLYKATSPILVTMIVIVDAGRIAGFSLGEVSDYVAMVALADPPLGAQRPESILSMFDRPRPDDARFALTASDRSFLAGLYATSGNVDASQQRGGIYTRIKRDRQAAQQAQP